MRPLAQISGRLERLRGRLITFVPVMLGCGIGLYFALPREPGAAAWLAIALASGGFCLVAWHGWHSAFAGLAQLAAALALVGAGLLLAGLRTETVRAPVLGFHYYGPVEGRIVAIDRSGSNAVRLTLDHVRLARVRPGEVPARVRVSLHGAQGYFTPEPGQRVAMTANLSPPEGPVEPGGFDFQRKAWFDRIGAVGYVRSPALLLAPPGRGLFVSRLRARISTGVRAAIPGEAGAFAAAITTGDRTGMSPETLAALRRSNTAHLLAISGLHMGLIAGFVFAALRYGLALIPGFAAAWPVRKIAAVVALQAGAFYLALSGGNVATERAFVMVSVMFGAVILDRRALTLRAVAIAATLVLMLQPEALTEPGFQMSFAATTGLVAVWGWLRDWRGWQPPRLVRPVLAVVLTSAVAALATAPFAAAHFNQVSHYGLLANVLAVPVMGALVMPLAVLAALLWPFGLAWLALGAMRWPILWILGVARWVSNMEGAVGHVVSPPGGVLALIAAGGLVLALLHGRARALAVLPLAAGFGLWSMAERPGLLVSGSGGLVGVLTPAGRTLSKAQGEGFAAASWLENDGDAVSQEEAAARPGITRKDGVALARAGPLTLAQITGRDAAARLPLACAGADVVIVSTVIEGAPPAGCLMFDEAKLGQTGALALYPGPDGPRIETVATHAGTRPWVHSR